MNPVPAQPAIISTRKIIAALIGLTMIGFVTSSSLVAAAPEVILPEEARLSVFQQVTLFTVSQAEASALLSDPRVKSDPKAVREELKDKTASGRARIVSNLAVNARTGSTTRLESAYGLESEVIIQIDGSLKAKMAIASLTPPASAKLTVTDIKAQRGDTRFLGSFEEVKLDPQMPVRLVFVTFY